MQRKNEHHNKEGYDSERGIRLNALRKAKPDGAARQIFSQGIVLKETGP